MEANGGNNLEVFLAIGFHLSRYSSLRNKNIAYVFFSLELKGFVNYWFVVVFQVMLHTTKGRKHLNCKREKWMNYVLTTFPLLEQFFFFDKGKI